MLKETHFDTGVVTINYAEGGDPADPPLVLVHGGGNRWQNFLPILPQLILRWRVLALDMRGHGRSSRVPGAYRPEQIAEDVSALMEAHCDEPAVLFGHSLGGWVALLAAAERPERIRALILGDPPLNLERFLAYEGSEARIGMWKAIRRLAGPELSLAERIQALGDRPGMDMVGLRALAKSLGQVDPDVIFYHAHGRLDEYVEKVDLEGLLGQLRCPTLILGADPAAGGVNQDEDVERALSWLQNGLAVKLEGVGHGLGLGSWKVDSLLQAVISFLETV